MVRGIVYSPERDVSNMVNDKDGFKGNILLEIG